MFLELPKKAKICDYFRKELTNLKDQTASIQEEDKDSSSEDSSFSAESHVIETLNSSLQELGESPIDKKKIHSKKYATKKAKTINTAH